MQSLTLERLPEKKLTNTQIQTPKSPNHTSQRSIYSFSYSAQQLTQPVVVVERLCAIKGAAAAVSAQQLTLPVIVAERLRA